MALAQKKTVSKCNLFPSVSSSSFIAEDCNNGALSFLLPKLEHLL